MHQWEGNVTCFNCKKTIKSSQSRLVQQDETGKIYSDACEKCFSFFPQPSLEQALTLHMLNVTKNNQMYGRPSPEVIPGLNGTYSVYTNVYGRISSLPPEAQRLLKATELKNERQKYIRSLAVQDNPKDNTVNTISQTQSSNSHVPTLIWDELKFSTVKLEYCIDEIDFPHGHSIMKSLNLECPICLDFISDTQAMVFKCNHMICLDCSNAGKEGIKKKCPICDNGDSDPQIRSITSFLECIPRKCPICKHIFYTHQLMMDHLLQKKNKRCPQGRLCTGCDCLVSILHQCPEDIVRCPNIECIQPGIKRKDLNRHLEECIYSYILCDAPGCTEMVKKTNISKHYELCAYKTLQITQLNNAILYKFLSRLIFFGPQPEGPISKPNTRHIQIDSNECKLSTIGVNIYISPPVTNSELADVIMPLVQIWKDNSTDNLIIESSRSGAVTFQGYIFIKGISKYNIWRTQTKDILCIDIPFDCADDNLSIWMADVRVPVAGIARISNGHSRKTICIQIQLLDSKLTNSLRDWILSEKKEKN